jgi:hypothetical protein
MKWLLILVFAIILFFTACKKNNTDTNSENEPVVAAYLIPGHILTVNVYYQKSLSDTAKYGAPITGLQLSVSDGTNNVQLTETAKGTYTYSNLNFLVTGKSYTLQFKYSGYTVSANTTIPAAPKNFMESDSVIHLGNPTSGPNAIIDTAASLSWSNPDSLYHIAVFINSDYTSSPISSGHFGNSGSSNFELNADRTSAAYLTQRTFFYYGIYQVILFTVNPEYINFLKTNTSTSTSQTLTSSYTNINNGFGLFTAMQGDTVKLEDDY